MKLEIGIDMRALVATGGGLPHRVDQLCETGQRFVVDARRGGACGDALERGANRIQLNQILDRDLANLRAAERRARDEAEQLEVAKRLTDRRLAHPHFLREPRFDDARPRRQPAAENIVDQLFANLFTKYAPEHTRGLL